MTILYDDSTYDVYQYNSKQRKKVMFQFHRNILTVTTCFISSSIESSKE